MTKNLFVDPQIVSGEEVRQDPEVVAYITRADECLGAIGYTEHGERHASRVAKVAAQILKELGFSDREVTLAAIAGYLHDIGNLINREYHAQTGALIVSSILSRMGMDPEDLSAVMAAIGNHHEEDGSPVSHVAAAIILSDKADVHRSRVRNPAFVKFDIHDRVNYAVKKSTIHIDRDQKKINLSLSIDTTISSVMEYFEIFLSRMIMSRRAAEHLGCQFELVINEAKVL